MTTDRVEFRFYLEWKSCPGPHLPPTWQGETVITADLPLARDRHHVAKRGEWVTPGMIEPSVSPLRVWRGGRLLPDELAPGRDLYEIPHPATINA